MKYKIINFFKKPIVIVVSVAVVVGATVYGLYKNGKLFTKS